MNRSTGQRPDTTPVAFMALFPEFRAASWAAWRTILARITATVREVWVIAGRGGAKSRMSALLLVWKATRAYHLAPGEHVYCGLFAPDKKQAGITHAYVVGLMHAIPALRALIVKETQGRLELSNGVIVEILSATLAAPRGRSYACAVIEEAAFLPQDQSVSPDTELLRALRPALARVPGSLLIVVSSPYARRGILWQAWQKYHETSPADIVFVQAGTRELNPVFDARAVEQAYEDDPASAAAEYGAQFRTDVETFIDRDVIDAAVVPGRHELAYVPTRTYFAFMDFAGGSGQDSATLAIAHEEIRGEQSVAVLDVMREARPPFSPEQVCVDFAKVLKAYGVHTATADRWGGDFPSEQLRKRDVTVYPSERSKSEIYREFLPHLNSQRLELLDLPRLTAQLGGLERRTARGGRDSIDHGPGGHDDIANAACGALVEVLIPISRAAGVGHTTTDTDQRARLAAWERLEAHERAGEWHRSQLGTTRTIFRPVREGEDGEAGSTIHDGDPWK